MTKEHTKEKNFYDRFVRQGRNAGFNDDQIDFMWDWMTIAILEPHKFTNLENYTI